jgi:hypothetical protein
VTLPETCLLIGADEMFLTSLSVKRNRGLFIEEIRNAIIIVASDDCPGKLEEAGHSLLL